MHWQTSDRRITATDAVERFVNELYPSRKWKWVNALQGVFSLVDGIKLYRVVVSETGITIKNTDNCEQGGR